MNGAAILYAENTT